MTDRELLPCPFCGGTALPAFNQSSHRNLTPAWQISCPRYCVTMVRKSKTSVTKDWNTRAIDAHLQAPEPLPLEQEAKSEPVAVRVRIEDDKIAQITILEPGLQDGVHALYTHPTPPEQGDARDAALEEAARECERGMDGAWTKAEAIAGGTFAAAIRSLKRAELRKGADHG